LDGGYIIVVELELNHSNVTTIFILIIITAQQHLVQSFDLLNQFLPSSSMLDKGPPIWYF
jgi:hypothetical protein